MTKIIRKAALTREKLRSIIVKNPDVVFPGITLVDMQLGNEEEGIFEMLGADQDGRISLIDFECGESDSLLLRMLSQAQWLKKNERLVKRLFFNQNFDFSQTPRLILVAPVFSAQLLSAVRQILSHEIMGLSFSYLIQGQDDAIIFDEAFLNRPGRSQPRAAAYAYPEPPNMPRDVAAGAVLREPFNHAFPGEAALTAEEIAEFMDFDNKPA